MASSGRGVCAPSRVTPTATERSMHGSTLPGVTRDRNPPTVMMVVVMFPVGLTHPPTDAPAVLLGICRPIGGITTHATGRVAVT